jgi:glycosyltransferase involved in cell wall biosynthesis
MNSYEVTIAIPVYNAEKHIRESMLTALAQDYSSIEFLIIDDCSTDHSVDVVHQLQQEHPRGEDIRLVEQAHNSGVGVARNRAVDEAQGRYLFFMDADDFIIPTTISRMVQAGKVCEAQLVMGSYERVELYQPHQPRIKYQYPHLQFVGEDALAEFAFSRYGALQANIWNILMDLDFVRGTGLRFVETNFWEDMSFKYRLVPYVTRAVLLPDITYSYICRENTLSNFQVRSVIKKEEILRNVATIGTLKEDYHRIRGKSYFPGWLTFILKTDFFIICNALEARKRIDPPISDKELCGFLHTPMTFWETLRYGDWRSWIFKFMTILPPKLSVWAISLLIKKVR